MSKRWLAPLGLAAAALIAVGCGSSGSGSGSSGSGGTGSGSTHTSAPGSTSTALKTATIGGATVLTNAKGFTLYWFVPDTKTKSNCNGSCATFWPPVPAPATLATGIKGTLGSITRDNGAMQATFDGHPLYTYAGDTAPGQNKGNGVNASGGLWHEVTVSGTSTTSKSSHSGGSSGYGY